MRYRITRLKKIDSTNNYAKALAEKGHKEGRVVVSEFQTNGRGRFHRHWVSAPGENLLVSLILRPKHAIHKTPLITLSIAHAVKDAIEEYTGIKCLIKRPNDILIDKKKVCGILTEVNTSSSKVPYVIVGIGLNVNSTKETLIRGATSLRIAAGKKLNRKKILAVLLAHIKKQYEYFQKIH